MKRISCGRVITPAAASALDRRRCAPPVLIKVGLLTQPGECGRMIMAGNGGHRKDKHVPACRRSRNYLIAHTARSLQGKVVLVSLEFHTRGSQYPGAGI